jgi:hypothetical protein
MILHNSCEITPPGSQNYFLFLLLCNRYFAVSCHASVNTAKLFFTLSVCTLLSMALLLSTDTNSIAWVDKFLPRDWVGNKSNRFFFKTGIK